MPTYKTTAIVLGRHNLGEADRIIAFLTPDRGVVRAVAKGVRKIKSRMAGHLELFNEAELMLAEGRNLDIITSARLKRHTDFTNDYDKLKAAYLYAEMVQKTSGEAEDHPGEYQLLRDAYGALAREVAGPELELWFKLRLLDVLGYRPELRACVVCGSDDPSGKYFFNNDLGGIVDEGCRVSDNLPLSHGEIKLWRLAMTQDIGVLQRVEGAGRLATSSLEVCNGFLEHTFGRQFKSSEVLA